ncbi:hypothetical protein [Thalassomonas sp. RHCl1]|uniref:hypothetical protein n=1 Tax=Thalassomonas sp. RHCl1 TaxID=2995320 RepID=UPI00248B03B9|nr:hypothetical protein [Thalassomonas sp. RHCl1]
MSTISNAAQIMVDKLVADLNSETPLSAEDQLLVAKALDTMKNSTTFETALIAVVEEHFNTADAALTAAKNDINAAKASIETQSTNLNLIPGLQTSIDTSLSGMNSSLDSSLATIAPTVRDTIGGSFNKFQIGYNAYEHQLHRNHDSNGYSKRAANVTCLDNYVTGEFYAYLDFGSQTTTYRRAHIVRVTKDQSVQVASKTSQLFTGGTFGFCPFADDTSRLCHYQSGTLNIQHVGAFSWEFSKAVDYQEIYYDKATKDLYVVSGGFLNKINTDGFVVVADTTFVDQAAFTAWAQAAGYLRADSFKTYLHSHSSTSSISNSSSYFSAAYLTSYIGGESASYTNFTGFDATSGIKAVTRLAPQHFLIGETAITPKSGTTTYPMLSTLRGQTSFVDIYGNYARLAVEYHANANLYNPSSQNMQSPVFIAYSHIHKCLIWSIGGYDHYQTTSGNYHSNTSLSFGR